MYKHSKIRQRMSENIFTLSYLDWT